MVFHLPTSSSIERGMHCQASHRLPRVASTGESARRGAAVHKFLEELLITDQPGEALARVPKEYRELCGALDPTECLSDICNPTPEVTFVYNVFNRKATIVGSRLERAYDKLNLVRGDIPGTVDVMGSLQDGTPAFVDYKTSTDIGPANESWQLRYFATAMAALPRLGDPDDLDSLYSVHGRIGYVREDGAIESELEDYYVDTDITEYADALEGMYVRLEGEGIIGEGVHAGRWCRYCPSVIYCPTQIAIARAMVGELSFLSTGVYELSDEQASKAWDMISIIMPLAEGVQAALKNRARTRPIPRGPGKVLAEVQSKRHGFDKSKALLTLRQLGATQSQIDGCKTTKYFPVVRECSIKKLPENT